MKSNLKILLLSGLFPLFFTHGAFAQVPAGYTVARWYQFKTSAVTYTFDDNTAKQYTVALPILNKYGFKATFYPVTNWSPNWTILRNAVKNGHEVGSHTLTHADLSKVDTVQQKEEVSSSRTTIDEQITTTKCLTISYPYCATGRMSYVQSNYIAGRICSGSIVPYTPSDFYKISSMMVGSETSIKTASDLNKKIALAKSSSGWCVFLIHGIDDDGGYSAIASAELDSNLAYIKANSKDYWFVTFLNAVKYIKERNSLFITETLITADSLQITASDKLNDTIYNLPVSIKRILPAGWDSAKVYCDSVLIPSYVSTAGSNKYVIFDLVPDKGIISIVNDTNVVNTISASFHIPAIRILPNPFTQAAIIDVEGDFLYEVMGLHGELLEKGTGSGRHEFGYLLEPGFYILNLNGTSWKQSFKIVKI